jgi:hypothetical protein
LKGFERSGIAAEFSKAHFLFGPFIGVTLSIVLN